MSTICRVVFLILLLICSFSFGQTTIWLEDFTDRSNGDTIDVGATAWTRDVSACNLTNSADAHFEVRNNRFSSSDTDGEAVWMSEYIDISSASNVKISIYVEGAGSLDNGGGNQDYMRAYYKLDNGGETVFFNETGDLSTPIMNSCGGLNGDSLQIVVRTYTTGGDEFYYFDDVYIYSDTTTPTSGGNELYAITDGIWDDGTTWSSTSGGSSCSCIPNANSEVFIECGYTVTIDSDENTKDLTLKTGAILTWNGNNDELTINNGGTITIENGAAIFYDGYNNAEIDFVGTDTSRVIIEATNGIQVDDFIINGTLPVLLSGRGSMYVEDDIDINASGKLYNNLEKGITVDDRLEIFADTAQVHNYSSIILDGDFNIDDCDNAAFYNYSGAILEVNGDDLEMNNTTNNFTFHNYGTATVLDDIINRGTGTGETWYNYSGGVANWGHNSNNLDLTVYANYSSNIINYVRGGDQQMFDPADNYWNLGLGTSGAKESSNNLIVAGDVIISGSAQLDINTNNDDLTVGGDWTNSSSNGDPFDDGGQLVTFNGSGNQSLIAPGIEDFTDVVINKSGGELTLNSPINIFSGGSLNFTQGVINSDSTNYVSFEDGATTNGGDADSYVSGFVRKIGNDDFIFPLGDGGNWHRLEISNATGAAVTDEFQAVYVRGTHPQAFWDSLTYSGNPGGMYNTSILDFWRLYRTNGSAQPFVKLSWESADSAQIDNLSDLVVAHYTGSSTWENLGGTTTGSIASGTVETTNRVNSFSPFTFGSTSNTSNPLPVTLTDFSAQALNDIVQVIWTTESEINNDYFEVERSIDGKNFEVIGKLAGAGNHHGELNYRFIDQKPYLNRYSYYRLAQFDYDGSKSYSSIDAVMISDNRAIEPLIFPNPSSGGEIFVNYPGFSGEQVSYFIFNELGNLVLESNVRWGNDDLVTLSIPTKEGIYILKIIGSSSTITERIIVR